MNQLTVHKKEYSKDLTDQGELYVAFEFGNKQSARIEGRLRQIKASRLRKPLGRFKTEGTTHVLSEKRTLITGGLIEVIYQLFPIAF